jgi:demethylmenaquinone methyltransferase/2-methoxy-6-polyprenyl-1,4-benzoquinol methylase
LELLDARPGERILEIGFGTGHTLLALSRLVGNEGYICGIDLSPGMITCARRRFESEDACGRAAFIHGDAVRLPFRDASFDALWMSFTLELFGGDEIPRVLHECHRILAGKGRLCILSMARTTKANLMSQTYVWMQTKFPQFIDCRPIALEAFLSQTSFVLRTKKQLSLWGLPVDVVLARRE